jgi:ornithine cyclodeaminase/alanine dehydrogenase-like protein (mu-crystallin family)
VTLHLASEDVRRLVTHEVAMRAARAVLQAQREGDFALPPRLDVDLPNGFLRSMPAALAPYMGMKVMSLARGIGNRYLILVYSQEDGDLLAVIDAAEVTQLRTAATTAVAGDLLAPEGTELLGLLGSGWEAAGHLRAFAQQWPLKQVLVHSPNVERCASFAERMTEELGIDVTPVATSAEAVGTPPVTLLCTKAPTPVVDGSAFPPGAVVLSIGSTRPDLRELDDATMRRTGVLLVDDPRQVVAESGDIATGLESGALSPDHIVAMHEWAETPATPGRDLRTFKSVGTALQDLALAAELISAARASGVGREIGELAALKPHAARPTSIVEQTS